MSIEVEISPISTHYEIHWLGPGLLGGSSWQALCEEDGSGRSYRRPTLAQVLPDYEIAKKAFAKRAPIRIVRVTQEMVVPKKPKRASTRLLPSTCPYCEFEESEGELIMQCKSCKMKDMAK
jgi:hypothetical protein